MTARPCEAQRFTIALARRESVAAYAHVPLTRDRIASLIRGSGPTGQARDLVRMVRTRGMRVRRGEKIEASVAHRRDPSWRQPHRREPRRGASTIQAVVMTGRAGRQARRNRVPMSEAGALACPLARAERARSGVAVPTALPRRAPRAEQATPSSTAAPPGTTSATSSELCPDRAAAVSSSRMAGCSPRPAAALIL
jgi:hypothetical protein